MLPLSEAEQRVLFGVMPDQVLRIALEEDGTVAAIGEQSRVRVSTKSAGDSDDQDSGEEHAAGPLRVLYED